MKYYVNVFYNSIHLCGNKLWKYLIYINEVIRQILLEDWLMTIEIIDFSCSERMNKKKTKY